MIPKLDGIDHVHVYVKDREQAGAWYESVLGFTVVEEFAFWAEDKQGPLTLEDANGKIHLALFEREKFEPDSVIAFKADGNEFLEWKIYLEKADILLRCTDHDKSWSLYFNDPDGNMHEITTYQYDYVSERLNAGNG